MKRIVCCPQCEFGLMRNSTRIRWTEKSKHCCMQKRLGTSYGMDNEISNGMSNGIYDGMSKFELHSNLHFHYHDPQSLHNYKEAHYFHVANDSIYKNHHAAHNIQDTTRQRSTFSWRMQNGLPGSIDPTKSGQKMDSRVYFRIPNDKHTSPLSPLCYLSYLSPFSQLTPLSHLGHSFRLDNSDLLLRGSNLEVTVYNSKYEGRKYSTFASRSKEFSEGDPQMFHLYRYRKWYFEEQILRKCFNVDSVLDLLQQNEPSVSHLSPIPSSHSFSFSVLSQLAETHGIGGQYFVEAYDNELHMLLDLYPELKEQILMLIPFSYISPLQWEEYSSVLRRRMEELFQISQPMDWYNISRIALKNVNCNALLPLNFRMIILQKWYPEFDWKIDDFEQQKDAILNWLMLLCSIYFHGEDTSAHSDLNTVKFQVYSMSSTQVPRDNAVDLCVVYCEKSSFKDDSDLHTLMQQSIHQVDPELQQIMERNLSLKAQEHIFKLKRTSSVILIPYSWNQTYNQLFNIISSSKLPPHFESSAPSSKSNTEVDKKTFTTIEESNQEKVKWLSVSVMKGGIRALYSKGTTFIKLKSGVRCPIPKELQEILNSLFQSIDCPIEIYLRLHNKSSWHKKVHMVLIESKSMKWWIKNVTITILDILDTQSPFWMRNEDIWSTIHQFQLLVLKYNLQNSFLQFTKPSTIKMNGAKNLLDDGSIIYMYHPNAFYIPCYNLGLVSQLREGPKIHAFIHKINDTTIQIELPFGAKLHAKINGCDDMLKVRNVYELTLKIIPSSSEFEIVSMTPFELAWENVIKLFYKQKIHQMSLGMKNTIILQSILNTFMQHQESKVFQDYKASNLVKMQLDCFLGLYLSQNPLDLYPSEKNLHDLSLILSIPISILRQHMKKIRHDIRNLPGSVTNDVKQYLENWKSANLKKASMPTHSQLQQLSSDLSITRQQVLHYLDPPGEINDKKINSIKSMGKQRLSIHELLKLRNETGLSILQIKRILREIHDTPGQITTDVKHYIQTFLQNKEDAPVTRIEFQNLKKVTKLSSQQLSKIIKSMQRSLKPLTFVDEEHLESWLLENLEKPCAEDIIYLSKHTGLSPKQTSSKLTRITNFHCTNNQEIRSYLEEWLLSHNYEMPNEDEYLNLMEITSLSREQVRKRLSYLRRSRNSNESSSMHNL